MTATATDPIGNTSEFSFLAVLDVDGNGKYDALTDGLIVLRYMFGLTGPSLTSGAVGNGATRSDPSAVLAYLNGVRAWLDVDDNQQVDALTDGLMILRYMFGLRGASLTDGALGSGAARNTSQIESYIQSLMP